MLTGAAVPCLFDFLTFADDDSDKVSSIGMKNMRKKKGKNGHIDGKVK